MWMRRLCWIFFAVAACATDSSAWSNGTSKGFDEDPVQAPVPLYSLGVDSCDAYAELYGQVIAGDKDDLESLRVAEAVQVYVAGMLTALNLERGVDVLEGTDFGAHQLFTGAVMDACLEADSPRPQVANLVIEVLNANTTAKAPAP